jgi:hypothetical protein
VALHHPIEILADSYAPTLSSVFPYRALHSKVDAATYATAEYFQGGVAPRTRHERE